MAPRATRTTALAKSTAELRFRELVDEIKLLTVAFPHLREAFDSDDLPVAFLLRRGADRAARLAGKPAKKSVAKRARAGRGKKAQA
jgi:hypothetical protein